MAATPDLPAAVGSLPRDHLTMLRAAIAGARAEELAALARVPVEAVVPLLRLATAKLDRALSDADSPATASADPVGGADPGDSTPRPG